MKYTVTFSNRVKRILDGESTSASKIVWKILSDILPMFLFIHAENIGKPSPSCPWEIPIGEFLRKNPHGIINRATFFMDFSGTPEAEKGVGHHSLEVRLFFSDPRGELCFSVFHDEEGVSRGFDDESTI